MAEILLVDDERTIRDSLSRLLREAGFAVRAAKSTCSTRSARLNDLTPTVGKAASATAAAYAPRIQTAAHCPGRARSVASGVSEPTSSHGD